MFYYAFPSDLREELDAVLNILPNKTFNDIRISTSNDIISYTINNSIIEIPYRMYLMDISDAIYYTLGDKQKQLLCCIYSRSCDGYIREKYLRKLMDMPFEYWAIPFIVKLCDEYVLEIIEVIYSNLKARNNVDIQNFCDSNKDIIRKSYSRMTSYWNEYYRGEACNFKDYIGRKLFRECFGYDRSFER